MEEVGGGQAEKLKAENGGPEGRDQRAAFVF
jgi:hypothetical protein